MCECDCNTRMHIVYCILQWILLCCEVAFFTHAAHTQNGLVKLPYQATML